MRKKKEQPCELAIAHGKNMRLAREAKGMSQQQVGEALGVTFQQVQKYENGSNRISLPTAHKICAILGISINELIGHMQTEQGTELHSLMKRLSRHIRWETIFGERYLVIPTGKTTTLTQQAQDVERVLEILKG